jgi:tetratricopeptide (TPR) repeat protein
MARLNFLFAILLVFVFVASVEGSMFGHPIIQKILDFFGMGSKPNPATPAPAPMPIDDKPIVSPVVDVMKPNVEEPKVNVDPLAHEPIINNNENNKNNNNAANAAANIAANTAANIAANTEGTVTVGEYLKICNEKIKQREMDLALDCLLHVLEAEPDIHEANMMLGAVLLSLKRPTESLGFLHTAVRVSNWTDTTSVANLAEALRLTGDLELAEQTAVKGLFVMGEAGTDPNGLLAYTMGSVFESKKKFRDASDWFLRSALENKANIDAWIRSSTLHFPPENWDFKLAENVLVDAITNNPNNAFLMFEMGVVMQRTSRIDKSIIFFQRAIELDTDNSLVDSWAVFATALHSVRRFPEAIVAYQRALTQSPNNHIMLANFAKLLCYDSVNQVSDGLQVAGRALQLAPENADAKDAFLLCQTLQQKQQV